MEITLNVHQRMSEFKKCSMYTQWNIFQCQKKKEALSFMSTWMNLEGITLTNKPDTERQTPRDLTCMWNFKKLNS